MHQDGVSDAGNHTVSGLHQGGSYLTLAQLHLAYGVGSDDGGDALGARLPADLGGLRMVSNDFIELFLRQRDLLGSICEA